MPSSDADVFVERDFIWQRTSEGQTPLVPLASIRADRAAHAEQRGRGHAPSPRAAGATGEAMARALEGFTGLEHVMEPVATIGGVRFVNDSKATNVDAARPIDRELRSRRRHHRRPLQGRRVRGPARAAARRADAASWRSARRGRSCGSALADVVPVVEAESMGEAVARGVRARPAGRRRACWRRPVRASTCSATTRIAGACSKRKCCV